MKVANTVLLILIVMSLSLQEGYGQTSSCPADNEQAKQTVKEFLSKERNIQSLQDQYDMSVSDSTKDNIISLTGEAHKEECHQLNLNLDWLQEQEHYSFYKVADHYFIVLYSFTSEDKFRMNEIPIIDNKYEFLGSILNFDASQ